MDPSKRPEPGEAFGRSQRRGERLDDTGDDVEGHASGPAKGFRGEEAGGPSRQRRLIDDETDVEGHASGPAKGFRGEEAGGPSRQRRLVDDDSDVEGHAAGGSPQRR